MGCKSSKPEDSNVPGHFTVSLQRDGSDLVKVTAPDTPTAFNSSIKCPKCTYLNMPGAETCEMCNTSLKPAIPSSVTELPTRSTEIMPSPSDGSETTTTDNNIPVNESVRAITPPINPTAAAAVSSQKQSPGDDDMAVAVDAFDVHLEVDEGIFGRQSFEGDEGFSNFDAFDDAMRPKKATDPFEQLDTALASNDDVNPTMTLDANARDENENEAVVEKQNEKEMVEEDEADVKAKERQKEEEEERIASAVAFAKNTFEKEQQRLQKMKEDQEDALKNENAAVGLLDTNASADAATASGVEEIEEAAKEAKEASTLQNNRGQPTEDVDDLLQQAQQLIQDKDKDANPLKNEQRGNEQVEVLDDANDEVPSPVRMESFESEAATSPLNLFKLTEHAWFSVADKGRVYASLNMSSKELRYYSTEEKDESLGVCEINSYSQLQKEDVDVDSYNIEIVGKNVGSSAKLSTTDVALRDHWYNAVHTLIHGNLPNNEDVASLASPEKEKTDLSASVEMEDAGVDDDTAGSPSSKGSNSPKKKKKNKKKGKSQAP